MPELVVSGWRRLLHNQRALYVKRLLLFEPRVILSSVPVPAPLRRTASEACLALAPQGVEGAAVTTVVAVEVAVPVPYGFCAVTTMVIVAPTSSGATT